MQTANNHSSNIGRTFRNGIDEEEKTNKCFEKRKTTSEKRNEETENNP